MTQLLAIDGEGEKLDRFELISELASGGMATVYLARLLGVAGFQRLVAIKRLHPHLAKDPDFVDMFLDEARLAARIHHPNVVSIQEVGQNRHGYYLVMDYVEGATLGKLLTRAAREGKRVPFDVVLRIFLDTLAGLHAAHELQGDDGALLEIVHRDVSPQNILLGADGVTRLSDFGVARAQARISVTKTGQLKGKLAYMAPEQAKGLPVDRRADLFATGIVLWESFALRRLFKGDTDAEVLNKVLHEPIPAVHRATPLVSPALEAVVMRTLERDPAKRPASALELAEQLEEVAKAEGLLATARDVARCLDGFFGEELTGHRESIRSLLSSAPRRVRVGAPLGSGADPDQIPTLAQEPSTLAEPRGSVRPAPSSEHSVAAIQVEGQRISAAPSPPARRTSRWIVALALGIGVGGVATAAVTAYRKRTALPEIPVAAEAPTASAQPVPRIVPPLPSVEQAAALTSAAASSAPSTPPKVDGRRKPRPPQDPGGGGDIGKNPYRQ